MCVNVALRHSERFFYFIGCRSRGDVITVVEIAGIRIPTECNVREVGKPLLSVHPLVLLAKHTKDLIVIPIHLIKVTHLIVCRTVKSEKIVKVADLGGNELAVIEK